MLAYYYHCMECNKYEREPNEHRNLRLEYTLYILILLSIFLNFGGKKS